MATLRAYRIVFVFVCALAQGLWVGAQIHALGNPGHDSVSKSRPASTPKIFRSVACCNARSLCARQNSSAAMYAGEASNLCTICQGQQAPVLTPVPQADRIVTVERAEFTPLFAEQSQPIPSFSPHAGRGPPAIL